MHHPVFIINCRCPEFVFTITRNIKESCRCSINYLNSRSISINSIIKSSYYWSTKSTCNTHFVIIEHIGSNSRIVNNQFSTFSCIVSNIQFGFIGRNQSTVIGYHCSNLCSPIHQFSIKLHCKGCSYKIGNCGKRCPDIVSEVFKGDCFYNFIVPVGNFSIEDILVSIISIKAHCGNQSIRFPVSRRNDSNCFSYAINISGIIISHNAKVVITHYQTCSIPVNTIRSFSISSNENIYPIIIIPEFYFFHSGSNLSNLSIKDIKSIYINSSGCS